MEVIMEEECKEEDIFWQLVQINKNLKNINLTLSELLNEYRNSEYK